MAAISDREGAARPPDRTATEAALRQATLDLLSRNGVLSGLNLKEVADGAGVNRGLVYHYFGSRRDLLRAALRADVRERMTELGRIRKLPLRRRHAAFFKTMLRQRAAIVLAALLVLDGDTGLRMIPHPHLTASLFRRDVDTGHLADDVDRTGLHMNLVSSVYGYLIFRKRFARELGIPLRQLDARFVATADRMLAGLEPHFG